MSLTRLLMHPFSALVFWLDDKKSTCATYNVMLQQFSKVFFWRCAYLE